MAPSKSLENADKLEHVALFAGLSQDALQRISRRCGWRSFAAGERVIDYIDPAKDVYFIVAGSVRVSIYSVDGKAVTFSDLAAGDTFGEYVAIDGGARSAAVEARTACRLASMPAATFRELLQAEPSVTFALLRRSVVKVRELTMRVYEFSALAVNNRIQAELLRLANFGVRDGASARIEPAPIHSDIASRTSTHREAVTRELSRLSRTGLVERRGKVLIVTNVDRLAAMVHEVTGE